MRAAADRPRGPTRTTLCGSAMPPPGGAAGAAGEAAAAPQAEQCRPLPDQLQGSLQSDYAKWAPSTLTGTIPSLAC